MRNNFWIFLYAVAFIGLVSCKSDYKEIPEIQKTYATNWGYFTLNMTIILVAPVIVYLFLPFFRRLNITTAYEYLEKRFNLAARLLGSIMFVLLQFGRIGIVLFLARLITVMVGLAGTGFALIMAGWDIKSLWDQLNTFIGLFAGGLGGLFLLGICSTRANGYGAVTGLLASGIIQFLVKEFSTLSFLLYTFTGIVACFTIGYVASLLVFPKKGKSIEGLTWYNLTPKGKSQ